MPSLLKESGFPEAIEVESHAQLNRCECTEGERKLLQTMG